jgi:pimeloyl-ACP methyl ester carboxylesterase
MVEAERSAAMRQRHILNLGASGFHRVAYTEWGDPASPRVLICAHGMTRCGRDFDSLAEALAERWRVVCPDMPGRGESEWLPVKADYTIPTYLAASMALIARLDVEQVDWLGTSMGGIIGMALAGLPGSPIRRLVVNDIGPVIPTDAIDRIAGYVGRDPHFASRSEAEAYLREMMAPFGIRRPQDWDHIVEVSTRPAEDGKIRLHYDPGIAEAFVREELDNASCWPIWDAIRCPVLILRGVTSDVLLHETAQEMTERGRRVTLREFADCGHAPALMEPEQIRAVGEWLESD